MSLQKFLLGTHRSLSGLCRNVPRCSASVCTNGLLSPDESECHRRAHLRRTLSARCSNQSLINFIIADKSKLIKVNISFHYSFFSSYARNKVFRFFIRKVFSQQNQVMNVERCLQWRAVSNQNFPKYQKLQTKTRAQITHELEHRQTYAMKRKAMSCRAIIIPKYKLLIMIQQNIH